MEVVFNGLSGSQSTIAPTISGVEYYILEKSGGEANYTDNYYSEGVITYDPVKEVVDASYANMSAAISAGVDRDLYKFMEDAIADPDALNFNQFDASNAVAYNWSDYFFDTANKWFATTSSMYTEEDIVIGTKTPPSSVYCKLSVFGSTKTRVLLSVPSNTNANNLSRITTDYQNKGYIFSKGLHISSSNLNTARLSSTDISLSDGDLYVAGNATLLNHQFFKMSVSGMLQG